MGSQAHSVTYVHESRHVEFQDDMIAGMIMTVLESVVEKQYWKALQKAFSDMTQEVPAAIKTSYLVQDKNDTSTWRIITVWESRESLDNMRNSGQTPTGVLIFQKAHAKPTLSIFDIHGSAGTT